MVTLAAPRSDAAGTGVVPGTGASESVNEAAQTADRAQIPTAVTSIAAGNTMQAYVVSVPAYKAYLTPGELRLLYLYERMNFDYDYGPFGTNFSDAIVATPLRMPQHPKNSAFTADVAGGNTLRGSPSETLDGALASEPEFGL